MAPLKKEVEKLNSELPFKCKELNVEKTNSDSSVDKDKLASLTKNLDILQGQYDAVLDELNNSDAAINNLKLNVAVVKRKIMNLSDKLFLQRMRYQNWS